MSYCNENFILTFRTNAMRKCRWDILKLPNFNLRITKRHCFPPKVQLYRKHKGGAVLMETYTEIRGPTQDFETRIIKVPRAYALLVKKSWKYLLVFIDHSFPFSVVKKTSALYFFQIFFRNSVLALVAYNISWVMLY